MEGNAASVGGMPSVHRAIERLKRLRISIKSIEDYKPYAKDKQAQKKLKALVAEADELEATVAAVREALDAAANDA